MTTVKTKWDTSTTPDLVKHFINVLSDENNRLRIKVNRLEAMQYCKFCGEYIGEVK